MLMNGVHQRGCSHQQQRPLTLTRVVLSVCLCVYLESIIISCHCHHFGFYALFISPSHCACVFLPILRFAAKENQNNTKSVDSRSDLFYCFVFLNRSTVAPRQLQL